MMSPFDEAAALAELERLRDALQIARKARIQKSEEFDRFVRTFRIASPSRPSENDVARLKAAGTQDDGTQRAVSSSSPSASSAVLSSHAMLRSRWRPGIVTMASILVLIVIAMAVPRRRTTAASPVPPPAAETPKAESAAPPPLPPQPVSVPDDRAAVQLELRTLAPVWIRVVVDGEKKIEAVIPATQRLSFKGTQSIVVRAGNGGDLLVRTDDHEDRFGAADQPLTRTFVPHADQNSPKH